MVREMKENKKIIHHTSVNKSLLFFMFVNFYPPSQWIYSEAGNNIFMEPNIKKIFKKHSGQV